VQVAELEQQANIRLVGTAERVAEEHHRVHSVLDDARGNLHVVAAGLGRDPFDLDIDPALDHSSCSSPRQKPDVGERATKLRENVDELCLFGSVGDDRDDRAMSRPCDRHLVNGSHAREASARMLMSRNDGVNPA
jgi:hypothetical protein